MATNDAQKKGVALNWVCSAPDLRLQCDRVRTEQIVWNLVNNAIKFTPAGGSVAVTLSQDGGMAQLCVADTGIGIAPENLEKVFGMFSQSGTFLQRRGGLGIGLALVKELSVAQGGDVVAASPGLGLGTMFTVRLPLAGHGQGALPDPQPAMASLQGLRVLLVDDLEDALALFAVVLEHEGAQVDAATSGAVALKLLALNSYDLLISDIGMPGMDGYALLAALRTLPEHAQMRTIAMTGYGRAADAERAKREGFGAHITKPVDFDALKKTIAGLGLVARTAEGQGMDAGTGTGTESGTGAASGNEAGAGIDTGAGADTAAGAGAGAGAGTGTDAIAQPDPSSNTPDGPAGPAA